MSDRFPAKIEIGGPTPKRLRDPLIRMIAAEHGSLNGSDKPKASTELIRRALRKGQFLCLYDDQAPSGQFYKLEAFLLKHKIHFNRHSDGYCEHDAQWVFYRGADQPLVMPSDQTAGILLYRESAAEILDDQRIDDQTKVAELRHLVYPPQLTELEPIRFV